MVYRHGNLAVTSSEWCFTGLLPSFLFCCGCVCVCVCVSQNYIPELSREDIPQAMRGKRNVIFGNIEKIYGFHHHYFLRELERCQHAPFLVGQCFLRHEQHFYLYALYNKNKPKSDALMQEYATAFFRVSSTSSPSSTFHFHFHFHHTKIRHLFLWFFYFSSIDSFSILF